MRGTEHAAATLVYVLGQFPSLSETFILREMIALENMGFRILPLSVQSAAAGPTHAEAEDLGRRTLYRPRPLSAGSWLGLLRTALQRPLGLCAALALLLRHAVIFPRCFPELVSALLAAASFASRLPRRTVRHVHCHFASYPTTVGLMLAEICGSGLSFSCHARDIFVEQPVLLPRKLREAEFVAVCTQNGLERVQRNHSLTSRDKLHLIHHGLDWARLSQQPRVQYPVPLLLAVGRLVEKKGFPFLLQAAAILAGRGMHFEVIIVGDGPERDELERLAGGLGLRDRVVFAGALSQEELAHVYRRAEVLCVPSVVAADGDRDGLPNVILEAMAYGVPVVASNLPGIAEAVIPEETGLLASPGSPTELAAAIERACGDQELREHLIRNARAKLAQDFDLQRNTVRLGSLFAQSLGLRNWSPPVAVARAGDRGPGTVDL
jgi:glycosyltransferase involved in cell wall biosynthesis